jgi:hypothetical protein
MGLRLGTMHYEDLRVNYLLDYPDDKKIDFFHIDNETGLATIAQAYESLDWTRPQAPANKAADLNTAMSWLLESRIDEIPRDALRAYAQELRDGLSTGEITGIELFYVHNLPGSTQVESELATVQRATQRLLEQFRNAAGQVPECIVREISCATVEEWRRSQHDNVSVHDDIELHSQVAVQTLETAEWHAAIASVLARELVDLNTRYGDSLCSANVRDYLGSRESSRNINRQIERTAEEEPQNFLIYNNGATVLTNRIEIDGRKVKLAGVSVINGAQTLVVLPRPPLEAHWATHFFWCGSSNAMTGHWLNRLSDIIARRIQLRHGNCE